MEANGFYKRRQNGSHATYKNDDINITIVIPVGRKDAHDLVSDVRKALKLTWAELERKLKDF